jgi:hypothetical protein
MRSYVIELCEVVESVYFELLALTGNQSAQRPAPGKWSPREIIGHLIDSASVNHQRFVRAQFQDDLIFPPYDGDEWVRVQRYQDGDWEELLTLWRGYNLHLARVMAAVPEDVGKRKRVKHNLNEIAWQTVPEGEATTLDYLMRDYVGHMKNHLRQIIRIANSGLLLNN